MIMLDTQGFGLRQVQGGKMTLNVADSPKYEKFCVKILSNTPEIRIGGIRTSYKWASFARQRLCEGLCFHAHKIY